MATPVNAETPIVYPTTHDRPTCEYLGRVYMDSGDASARCHNDAQGRLYGTGGEPGPLACWTCAAVALEYEDGARGYLPLPASADDPYMAAHASLVARHRADCERCRADAASPLGHACGECGERPATRHEEGGPYLCDQCES